MNTHALVDRLWSRFFRGDELTDDEERRVRMSRPRVAPNGVGHSMGPPPPYFRVARMPCYLCGSKETTAPRVLHSFADHTVRPEGVFRLCDGCAPRARNFADVEKTHYRRLAAIELNDSWRSLTYYHPSGTRELL